MNARRWLPVLLTLLPATALAANADGDSLPAPSPTRSDYVALDDSTYIPMYQLDTVVVTGSRTEQRLADVTVATELIQREDLERSGAVDLADFLDKQAGVVVSHSIFGSGVQLQGLGSEYVLVLVDGERVLGRKGGVIDLSRYATDNIERIEVVKGNQSALYGADAIGGVINIITRGSRHPLEMDFHGDFGEGGNRDLGASLGYRGKAWTSRFTGSWDEADPYDINTADPETSVDGFKELSFANHSEWQLGERSKFKGQASYISRDQNGIDGGTTASPAVFDRSNSTEVFSVSMGPDIHAASGNRTRASLQFSFYLDQYLEDQRLSNELDQYQETRQRLLHGSAQHDRLLPARNLLSTGVEAFQEWIETERLEDGQSDRERLGVFLQDQWEHGDRGQFKLIGGLRMDYDSQFGSHFTPKLSLRRDLTESLILRGGVGEGFRAPDFKELYVYFAHPAVGYVVYGNPDLEPEVSRSANLGLEWRSNQGFWFSVNGFYHDFDNLIQGLITDELVGGLNKAVYVNVARATIRGAEATLRLRPLPPLECELSYAFLDSRDQDTGSILDGRPRHRGTVNLDYRFVRLDADLSLRASLVGSRAFTEETSGVETTKADPYALLDLRLRKSLGTHLGLSFGMNNVTDAGDHDYLRVPPRRLFAGFHIRRNHS